MDVVIEASARSVGGFGGHPGVMWMPLMGGTWKKNVPGSPCADVGGGTSCRCSRCHVNFVAAAAVAAAVDSAAVLAVSAAVE